MESEYQKALDRALKLLSTKARTVEEIRELLGERHRFDSAVAERVVGRLRQLGYLNDEQFAADLAASRLRSRPMGRRRMKRELRQKKLSEGVVESTVRMAYESRDEKELLNEAIRRRIHARGTPKNPRELKRLYDYLLRLGFGYEEIRLGLARISELSIED